MTVEKPKPKQFFRPITTGTDSATNQSQFLAITCNSKPGEKNHAYMVRLVLVLRLIGWKTWRESFEPITKHSQSRNYYRQSFENCSITTVNEICHFFSVVIRLSSTCLIPKFGYLHDVRPTAQRWESFASNPVDQIRFLSLRCICKERVGSLICFERFFLPSPKTSVSIYWIWLGLIKFDLLYYA